MIQVTAITGAYNAASYIENCIQSVLAQTVPCRMIIVDDASRDDTYAIAMRYAEEYPDRITVLKNEQNAGAAASRNRAVACATTPYVAILDADDWWQEDKTERQLKRLAETKADACYAGTDACRRNLYHEDRAGSGDGHIPWTSQGERHPVFFRADAPGGCAAVSDDA